MANAASLDALRLFFVSFAGLIAALGRCVRDKREDHYAAPIYALVQDRLDTLFACVQRAVTAFELGRPKRTASAAFIAAGRAAAERRAAEAAAGQHRPRGFRMGLPRSLGWLVRFVPDAEAYHRRLAEIVNDPSLAEWLPEAPAAQRALRSLCNMLGITPYRVSEAAIPVLGHFSYTHGWTAEPPDRRRAAAARKPGRRQNE